LFVFFAFIDQKNQCNLKNKSKGKLEWI